MAATRMHIDELGVDVDLARRLVSSQFPGLFPLGVSPVDSPGTDNALFRLGDELVVRLPRVASAAGQVEKEQLWLPRLASHLPLRIPEPVEHGQPTSQFPFEWSIYRWIPGELALFEALEDPTGDAARLGEFVAALHDFDPTGVPLPGAHNFYRGDALYDRDEATRQAIASLGDLLEVTAVAAVWERALEASAFEGAPVPLHGDLQAGNLIADHGRLSAVVDFGGFAAGDPACDVMAAWLYLRDPARAAFRQALEVDEDTWERGKGWALTVSAVALPYYRDTNAFISAISLQAILEVLGAGS